VFTVTVIKVNRVQNFKFVKGKSRPYRGSLKVKNQGWVSVYLAKVKNGNSIGSFFNKLFKSNCCRTETRALERMRNYGLTLITMNLSQSESQPNLS